MPSVMNVLEEQRSLAVIRADALEDPIALAGALRAGGIDAIELTFTTPGIERAIGVLSDEGALVGAGTVVTATQALAAIRAGARFLVTPCVVPDVIAISVDHEIPIIVGALSPTEVHHAQRLGATAVKIFPSSSVGPKHIANLLGPFPELLALASGGIDASNAASYLDAGAFAVAAGSSVVSARAITNREWALIEQHAREFSAAVARG